ncbi:hypothetical protein [Mycobacterium spongiae]|uniref:Uncharacterized protein n=1 Tax=Mycobacterium spongiae TaxID=886343 RepID=A0A975JVK6_9MYCO|nr:hypothetical protein [Mycobacterium spongiae]QUR66140.1 hypothetical protein F6B93_02725 [Mycobacterium spongiae]
MSFVTTQRGALRAARPVSAVAAAPVASCVATYQVVGARSAATAPRGGA